MLVSTIIDERFDDYKLPVMFIGTISCSGKCCIEAGFPLSVCQNDGWRETAPIAMVDDEIIKRYIQNPITKGICFGGLEPFEQFEEVLSFISKLRTEYRCDDTVIIYTGYNKTEILSQVKSLSAFKNIIIKFGRFVPNDVSHFDELLGVSLASYNQYAEQIS